MDDEVPVLFGDVDDRRLANQPGVVDENVKTAELLLGFTEGPGNLIGIADVALNGVDFAAAELRRSRSATFWALSRCRSKTATSAPSRANA